MENSKSVPNLGYDNQASYERFAPRENALDPDQVTKSTNSVSLLKLIHTKNF